MNKFIIPDPKPRKPRDPILIPRVDAIMMFRSATGASLSRSFEVFTANFGEGPVGHLRLAELIRTYYEYLLSRQTTEDGSEVPLRQACGEDDSRIRSITKHSPSDFGRYEDKWNDKYYRSR